MPKARLLLIRLAGVIKKGQIIGLRRKVNIYSSTAAGQGVAETKLSWGPRPTCNVPTGKDAIKQPMRRNVKRSHFVMVVIVVEICAQMV